MNTKKNIVVMGGSFNPPTIAHLRLIQTAIDGMEAERGYKYVWSADEITNWESMFFPGSAKRQLEWECGMTIFYAESDQVGEGITNASNYIPF